MKRTFFLFIIFLPVLAFASPRVEMELLRPEVKQGSLVPVIFKLDTEAVQKVQLQKLVGQTLGEVLYFHEVSPLLKKGDEFTAEGSVIFVKIPETNLIKNNGFDLSWSSVTVSPTETDKQFIFTDFEIPVRPNFMIIVLSVLSLLAILVLGRRIYKKHRLKKVARERKIKLKSLILGCKDYSEVVSFWMKRKELVEEFPHIEEPLRRLELILFRYQFKPHQSETERAEVMEAYRAFTRETEGGFHGI